MPVYRDELVRVSMAQIRASYMPRVYDKLTSVTVDHLGSATEVKIVRTVSRGTRGGIRRWLSCPCCSRKTSTLAWFSGRWWCRRCLGWKSRTPSGRYTSPAGYGPLNDDASSLAPTAESAPPTAVAAMRRATTTTVTPTATATTAAVPMSSSVEAGESPVPLSVG